MIFKFLTVHQNIQFGTIFSDDLLIPSQHIGYTLGHTLHTGYTQHTVRKCSEGKTPDYDGRKLKFWLFGNDNPFKYIY